MKTILYIIVGLALIGAAFAVEPYSCATTGFFETQLFGGANVSVSGDMNVNGYVNANGQLCIYNSCINSWADVNGTGGGGGGDVNGTDISPNNIQLGQGFINGLGCGNITGTASDLCTIVDTTGSFTNNTDILVQNIVLNHSFTGGLSWGNLTNIPSLGNDTLTIWLISHNGSYVDFINNATLTKWINHQAGIGNNTNQIQLAVLPLLSAEIGNNFTTYNTTILAYIANNNNTVINFITANNGTLIGYIQTNNATQNLWMLDVLSLEISNNNSVWDTNNDTLVTYINSKLWDGKGNSSAEMQVGVAPFIASSILGNFTAYNITIKSLLQFEILNNISSYNTTIKKFFLDYIQVGMNANRTDLNNTLKSYITANNVSVNTRIDDNNDTLTVRIESIPTWDGKSNSSLDFAPLLKIEFDGNNTYWNTNNGTVTALINSKLYWDGKGNSSAQMIAALLPTIATEVSNNNTYWTTNNDTITTKIDNIPTWDGKGNDSTTMRLAVNSSHTKLAFLNMQGNTEIWGNNYLKWMDVGGSTTYIYMQSNSQESVISSVDNPLRIEYGAVGSNIGGELGTDGLWNFTFIAIKGFTNGLGWYNLTNLPMLSNTSYLALEMANNNTYWTTNNNTITTRIASIPTWDGKGNSSAEMQVGVAPFLASSIPGNFTVYNATIKTYFADYLKSQFTNNNTYWTTNNNTVTTRIASIPTWDGKSNSSAEMQIGVAPFVLTSIVGNFTAYNITVKGYIQTEILNNFTNYNTTIKKYIWDTVSTEFTNNNTYWKNNNATVSLLINNNNASVTAGLNARPTNNSDVLFHNITSTGNSTLAKALHFDDYNSTHYRIWGG